MIPSFYGPFGLTTAEQRHHQFAISMKAMSASGTVQAGRTQQRSRWRHGQLLNRDKQSEINRRLSRPLKIYAKSHRLKQEDGRVGALD